MTTELTPEELVVTLIARVCHQLEQTHAALRGEQPAPVWDEAPEWMKSTVINGVRRHLDPNVSAADSHEIWKKEKFDDGWTWGPYRNENLKEHPALVADFNQLPPNETARFVAFRATVLAMKQFEADYYGAIKHGD